MHKILSYITHFTLAYSLSEIICVHTLSTTFNFAIDHYFCGGLL